MRHGTSRRSSRFTLIRATACAALLATRLATAGTAAAADRPSRQALPDETLAVVTVPQLQALYDALKTRTKIGAVLFDERRLEGIKQLILSESKEEWERLEAEFARRGLSRDDLAAAARGELGYAAAPLKRDGRPPLYVGLAWSACGQATAERLLAALDGWLADQPEGPDFVRREDVELGGVRARHLTLPLRGPKHGTFTFRLNWTGGKPEADAAVKPAAPPAGAEVVLAHAHLLIGRRGDALLAAHATIVEPGAEAEAERRNDPERDAEALRSLFAKFGEAHAGDAAGPVDRWLQTPGVREALPEGVPLVEAAGDLGGWLALADGPQAADLKKAAQSAGLDKIGPAVYRLTLEGSTARAGMFVALPQPRSGLAAIVDQPAVKPQPADWVSTDAVGYQHLSCDFGALYATVADLVRNHSPRGEGAVAALELQIRGALGIDPAPLLRSLGTSHTLLSFVPAADAVPVAGAGQEQLADTALAYVCRTTDEPLWRRLMQKAADGIARPIAVEQGFSGLRYEQGPLHGGWFLGDGYMIVAVGKGVTERILTMLRNPPRGEASLLGCAAGRRAVELLPRDEVFAYELTNSPSLLNLFNQSLLKALEEEPDKAKVARLKELWPTPKELEGLVGVSVSAVRADKNGITYRSAADLPAP